MTQYHAYTIIRVLKTGFVNLFRNLWLTIAATAVMLVALTIISFGLVLNVTTSNAIDVLSQELKTTVFLNESVTAEQRKELESEIRRLDFVTTVEYVSPEEAQQRLRDNPIIGDQALQASAIFEGKTFLQPSYEVAVRDLSRAVELESLSSNSRFEQMITRVSVGQTDTGQKTDAEKAIERAAAVEKFITIGSIIAAGTLSAVSVMIIFNTIRMAIYTRRDEIAIMKLIGATPNYIRGPFLVEASLYGVIAGIITNSIVYALIFTLGSKIADAQEFTQTYEYFTAPSTMTVMLLSSITLGVLIGAVSSMLAMERHLKLKDW